ncbi:GTP-binding protein [Stenotrophomonas mori]|uniref:GTP-binding protein n=1 Tax=Stenotrophomonas mori TaxID=2871096 RepID=A0ABT0SI46_9GAMM|nr:hypothetical protein [Stenotrophomonas mori]MCL7715013.1 hypothetical protein [Stenotrophomonas mori]
MTAAKDWSVAIMGPVGSGKTTVVRTASDIATVDTEVRLSASGEGDKPTTTVAMDMGTLELGEGARVRLLGAPGQARFDYMWDILLAQARAAIVLVDGTAADAERQLQHYLAQVTQRTVARGRALSAVLIGITRADRGQAVELERFRLRTRAGDCPCSVCQPPVVAVDTRDRGSVARLLLVATALLEMSERFPEAALHERLG